MRIIAGQLNPSKGKVYFTVAGKKLSPDAIYRHLSWSGPYVDLYHDLTITEHLKLHFQFRTCLLADPLELLEVLDLKAHRDKKLRFFSSGMLQRAKVGVALFTQGDLLLLDEPTSNMDTDNAQRILSLIDQHLGGRTYILASNMKREFEDMDHVLNLG